jgi:hypothetical protein
LNLAPSSSWRSFFVPSFALLRCASSFCWIADMLPFALCSCCLYRVCWWL